MKGQTLIIPEDLYCQICQVMPIPCVDLLVSDEDGYVLLVKRKSEPAMGQWWFPGGRAHFKETRAMAAVRKLKEECGLEAINMEELGTYDVILDIPSGDSPSHAITTLFHMRVRERGTFQLDDQSVAADWRTPQEWQKENLHSFVSKGLSFLLDYKEEM